MNVIMTDKDTFGHDPIAYALKRFGGKWKPHLLYGISHDEPLRFSKIMNAIPITEHVCAQTLRELEADGLLRREIYPEIPPRVEYYLTDTGRGAIELLNLVYAWGREQMTSQGIQPDPLGELHHGYITEEEYAEMTSS